MGLQKYKDFTLVIGNIKINIEGEYSFSGYYAHPKYNFLTGMDICEVYNERDLVDRVIKKLEEIEKDL